MKVISLTKLLMVICFYGPELLKRVSPPNQLYWKERETYPYNNQAQLMSNHLNTK